MMCDRELKPTKWEFATAADVKRMGFATLSLAIRGNFKIADDGRTCAFRNANRIAKVIAVAMRDKNEIGFDVIGADGGNGVAGEERIGEERTFRGLNVPTRVSVPR